MRESRTYGSVRGARGNSRPYREAHRLLHLLTSGSGTKRRKHCLALCPLLVKADALDVS